MALLFRLYEYSDIQDESFEFNTETLPWKGSEVSNDITAYREVHVNEGVPADSERSLKKYYKIKHLGTNPISVRLQSL